VIEAVLSTDQLNLVVAPHVRMLADTAKSTIAEWQALQVPGRFIFDPGSERSMDMTYTQGADIYLGDVSSQVYEFAATPRPCVFLNAHRAQWHDNPDYLMWRMGEVVESKQAILPALLRAAARHAEFVDLQRSMVNAALGDTGPDAPERAAQVILGELNRDALLSRAPA
jgi:CDP-glycerol glycerophosphotransferase (TagB/SpsB family)